MEAVLKKIDLNKLGAEPDQGGGRSFDPGIYKQMPAILADGLEVLTDESEKAVFLMGGLGVLSGLLPNIQGMYDGQMVSANLYVYVLGPYGSGKGGLRYAKDLGLDVHRAKLKETIRAKENRGEGEPEPPQLLHFIPANNSKTGFFELLKENLGRGTLFENEGDTLADAIRQDYGNFSDGLRKAFHHESISYYRRTNREFCEIEAPRLSVVLSSTADQLLALIPTAENGLFSRFCFFTLPPEPGFKNVFDKRKSDYGATFKRLGNDMTAVYDFLADQPDPVEFRFTTDQQRRFLEYFQDTKTATQQDVNNDLDGLINRLGLQYFRIAMILTTFRQFGADGLHPPMICSDQDFELTRQIIDVLKNHALDVYAQLPQSKEYDNRLIEKSDNVKRAIELRRSGLTYGAISDQIFGSVKHKGTIFKWINDKRY